ncbi:MAG: hypothetical protein JOY62_07160 [Acidobacteriaceae bacterium]|nr:hypothetical protein [Acidobacteriaceae bacterium]MBV9779736.1 hypothetical protein [Acidobacteriaceae bacterium]
MQQVLQQHPQARLRVFAVWEPVRFVDWQRPSTANLARLSDPRVSQFWDHDHLLANQIARDAAADQTQANCCEAKSILFDLAAVYPASATWSDHLPHANVFDGPIVDIIPKVQAALP